MPKSKLVEEEKNFDEQLNGSLAMISFITALGAYLTMGQIIPGFI